MRSAGLRFADVLIPEAELQWSFDTSGGPGGQHANRAASRVTLSFDLGTSASLSDAARSRLLERLENRAPQGVVSVSVDDTRSQWRNRAIARRRLMEILERASLPERTRRSTQPTASSRRRRLDMKRRRGQLKRQRQRPELED